MKTKNTYYICSIVLLLTIFSSCISPEDTNYLQTINKNYPKQEYKQYRLQPSDQIECAIYTHNKEFSQIFNKVISTNEKSSNVPYLIHHNGKILLPYFGEIEVAGLTTDEAEEHIQAFMRDAITDVEVNVRIVNNYFYILSDRQIQRGRHDIYKENMTIYQALAQANNGNASANGAASGTDLRNVTITRRGSDGNTVVKTFDLRSKDIIESEFYYVYPNDMLYFPTSSKTFFNISSISSFVNTMLTPITLLIMVTRVKF